VVLHLKVCSVDDSLSCFGRHYGQSSLFVCWCYDWSSLQWQWVCLLADAKTHVIVVTSRCSLLGALLHLEVLLRRCDRFRQWPLLLANIMVGPLCLSIVACQHYSWPSVLVNHVDSICSWWIASPSGLLASFACSASLKSGRRSLLSMTLLASTCRCYNWSSHLPTYSRSSLARYSCWTHGSLTWEHFYWIMLKIRSSRWWS